MAKADKSETPPEEKEAVEPKISDDVIDAEVVQDDGAAEENGSELDGDDETSPEPLKSNSQDEDAAVESETTADPGNTSETNEEDTPSDETLMDAADKGGDESVRQSDQQHSERSTPSTGPAVTQPVQKTGFLPVAFGGAVAAALGFGLAQYVGPLGAEKDAALVQLEATVQAQSEKIDALLATQADLGSGLGAANQSLQSTSETVQNLSGAVGQVNSRIDDATGALVTLDGRLTVLEKRPITQGLPSSAIQAYEREVEELKAAVAAQREEASQMEENAQLTAQQALARAALTRVLSALDSGASYRVALTDFAAATGTAAPAALEVYADTGVPSLTQLQDEFPDAARQALAQSRTETSDGGIKLTDFLMAQLGARSVTPQEGDSVDAILSRAEGALRSGHTRDALAELASLPDVAQPALKAWSEKAEARHAAFAVSEALSQQLNSN